MSMITGCPACGTMFKVVPDQLKISEGWVRCGHCSEVFDASAHMVPPAVLRQAGVPVAQDIPAGHDPSPVEDRVDVVAAEAPIDEPAAALPAFAVHEEPQAWHDEPVHQPVLARPSDDRATAAIDDEPVPAPFEAAPSIPVEPAPPAAPVDAAAAAGEPDPDDDASQVPLEDIGFIRKARRRAIWARPAVRAMLLLAALALAAVLAAQVTLEERDRLAATHPDLRPWLEKLCEPLACTISPPRRIEAIAIDSSTFSRLRADTFRLSFTLKNQAQQPVAIPAVELTLTDTQDQPVLRRVLQPGELGAAAATLASGGEWTANAAIAVNGSGSRVAGYRLLAFYP